MGIAPITAHDLVRVSQTFDKEVTTVVWGNFGGLMGVSHFGHAAVLVRMKRETEMHKVFECKGSKNGNKGRISAANLSIYRYFSFWPGDGASKGDAMVRQGGIFEKSYLADMSDEIGARAQDNLRKGVFKPKPNQKVIAITKGAGAVKATYGIEANRFVGLPVLQAGFPPRLGLNVWLMCEAANNFVASDHFAYVLASKTRNCSGVAARFLKAGGAEAFYSIPSIAHNPKNVFYMTPNDVDNMANAALRGVEQLNIILGHFVQIMRANMVALQNKAKFKKDDTTTIYSKRDWMNRSSVSYKVRGLVLRSIDDHIGNYHKYTWDNDYCKKLKELCRIIYYVDKHIKISKSGKRDDAIHMLVQQIVSVVLIEVTNYKTTTPWPAQSYLGENDSNTKGRKKG